MSYSEAQQKYTESSVLSATPEQRVVMLYDGVIRFLTQSVKAHEAGNLEMARNRMMRAEAIINELNITLDMEQEVAGQLRSFYLFCKRHLAEALIAKDTAKIRQVIELFAEMRAAWVQAASQQVSVGADA
jgi:flagellar protein FliS